MKLLTVFVALLAIIFVTSILAEEATIVKEGNQELCPIAGGKIDRDIFVDYDGKRIYFCCKECESKFLADPEKYLKEMEALGVEPATITVPQTDDVKTGMAEMEEMHKQHHPKTTETTTTTDTTDDIDTTLE